MRTLTRRSSGLLVPDSDGRLSIKSLDMRAGHFTHFGREWLRGREWLPSPDMVGMPAIAGGSGFSQYAAAKIIDHANGKTSWTMPAGCFIALTTVVPTSTSTGSSITEASYTGYARFSQAANWTAATAATPSVGVNTATISFAACTGGTSTLIGFALCDALTVGNVIFWGTLTSTVISVTQTPATIAATVLQTSAQ